MDVVWMADLAARSGVPVATVKYYLREGLLPAGSKVSATRSRYDEGHVARLRLVRALVEVAGMGLDDVRRVLAALDDPGAPLGAALGTAHLALSPPPATPPPGDHVARVARLLDRRGWRVGVDSPHAVALAAALATMADADHPLADEALETYADAMTEVGRSDVARTLVLDRDDAAALAVAGTVLAEPVLGALRRIVHQHLALERSADGPG